jgi:hypothetical protein
MSDQQPGSGDTVPDGRVITGHQQMSPTRYDITLTRMRPQAAQRQYSFQSPCLYPNMWHTDPHSRAVEKLRNVDPKYEFSSISYGVQWGPNMGRDVIISGALHLNSGRDARNSRENRNSVDVATGRQKNWGSRWADPPFRVCYQISISFVFPEINCELKHTARKKR